MFSIETDRWIFFHPDKSHWEPTWIATSPGEHLPSDLDQVAGERSQRRSTQSSQRSKKT